MATNAERKTRVLILGGGFGGVATAQELSKRFKGDGAVEITLVNRDNHFLFVPLLASAAAGSIETLHVVTPIRQLAPRVRFRAEEVLAIDLERRVVTTGSSATGRERQLPYDHLVLALGNVINLAKLPGVAQHGKTLKTLGDAIAIRNHVLQMLEAADIETDPVARREMLTFVVAGGGFSGVEMVGELNDLVREAIRHYPAIIPDQVRIILLHSNERILPEMSAGLAGYALQVLRKRGVEVRLKVRLAGATPHEAVLQGGDRIATRTLIVAVGNAPPPAIEALPVRKDRGRVVVDEYMQVPGVPGVWALGDNAIVPNQAGEGGKVAPSSPTAQYALRQGKTLAHNIAGAIRGGQPKKFSFGGLGLLCLVGHGAGIGELPGGIKVKGFIGWFMWRNVYWSKMPSFTRKVQVGVGWLLDLFIPRDIAQVNFARTQTVGRAHYEAGEYIFRQGEPGNHFYMIGQGEVEIVRERSSGEQNILARLDKGEYFGETALLSRRPRNASARCATPVDLITLDRDDFATLADTWLQLADSLKEVSDRRVVAAPATAFFPGLSAPGDGPAPPPPLGATPLGAANLIRRDSGGEIPLDRDLVSLGRSSDNHVVVADPLASRRHALIQREGDTFWLEDLGGQNGTRVNGERVAERVALADGDEIHIGKTALRFQRATRAAPPGESVTRLIEGLGGDTAEDVGSATRLIQGLDAPRQPAAANSGSLTGIIAGLDVPRPGAGGRPAPGNHPAPVAGRVLLQAIAGPMNGATFAVTEAGAVLGRARENAVFLDDPRLSRQHARIEYADGRYWLTDLGSTNGTFANRTRVDAPRPLRAGDVIELGSIHLAVTLQP